MYSKLKILIIYGTRPEAIKFAPLINLLKVDAEFNLKICVTGQHQDLLNSANLLFNIAPDYNLKLMTNNQQLHNLSAKILIDLHPILDDFKPHLVLVQGDTTTSFIASLASFYKHIKIGHVEAGLRTNNINEPFPEEFNRISISKLAYLNFCPTFNNYSNLIKEGIPKEKLFITGNTVVDALNHVLTNILDDYSLPQELIPYSNHINTNKVILITVHRRENFGQNLINICSAIKHLAVNFKDLLFILPAHPNPNVKNIILENLDSFDNIIIINPLDYKDLIYLLNKSYLVLTDSGGIQEEASSLSKPVLVLRNVTERIEAVEAGCVLLVGSDPSLIIANFTNILNDLSIYKSMLNNKKIYGNGDASTKILSILKNKKKDILGSI